MTNGRLARPFSFFAVTTRVPPSGFWSESELGRGKRRVIFGAGDFGLAITHSGPSGVSSTDSNEVMSGGGPSTIGTSPRAIWVQRRASRKSLGERFTFPGKFPSLRRADRSSTETLGS